MGKKSRRSNGAVAVLDPLDPADPLAPVVGQREPCPCGSARRYKACHGRAAREASSVWVARPFEGLTGECDWVALREIVPSATATVRTSVGHEWPGGVEVTVATVLPLAWPALRRPDGAVLVGLQTTTGSGDAGRDVAAALLAALDGEPGTPVESVAPGAVRLQDVLDADAPFAVDVHDGFDFWLTPGTDLTPDVRASLEQANDAVIPTRRLTGVDAAYWCAIGERRHLRWVLPHDEDALLDAIARLHAAGESALVEGSRYVGAFRADGLLVPVWDLPPDTEAADLESPAAAFSSALTQAMAQTSPLTALERRARAGVVGRQLTLR